MENNCNRSLVTLTLLYGNLSPRSALNDKKHVKLSIIIYNNTLEHFQNLVFESYSASLWCAQTVELLNCVLYLNGFEHFKHFISMVSNTKRTFNHTTNFVLVYFRFYPR